MKKKEVLLLLTDRWADWEAAYAVAEVNSAPGYSVTTVAADDAPKTSIGGVRALVDHTLADYAAGGFANTALLILPGGFAWGEGPHDDIADFVEQARAGGVPVAAICGATVFLAKHGFLDHVRHTGDEPEYFADLPGYRGRDRYVRAQVVWDGGFLTANETAAVEFAYEIYKLLAIDEPEELDAWYDKFRHGMVR